ncbi:MAG: complex I NDUFA9 subunit family protein [Candidatus Melainabacteria bacterium]|nr:complex I NDUFA9 subunit family protein [Candidatus Melainabacteria bacterium]
MILLTGGTGFLGARVLEGLIASGQSVRIATRGGQDWRGGVLAELKNSGAQVVLVDLTQSDKMIKFLEGCTAIINLVGIMRQDKEVSFQDINVELVRKLVLAAHECGIQRFVHVSCLGPHGQTQSRYFQSKREGEDIVRLGKFYWTIFRPSFMFGQQCQLVEALLPLVKNSPILPILGSGLNQVQPVFVDDVAACIVQCVYNKDTAGKTYELVGPKAYTQVELMQMLARAVGKDKQQVNIPTEALLKATGLTGKFLTKLPINEELIYMLISDSVADPRTMQTTFSVSMKNFESYLDQHVNKHQ